MRRPATLASIVAMLLMVVVGGAPVTADAGEFDVLALGTRGAGEPADDLDALWNNYGDQGGHWTGGDRTASVPLPDGRTAWLFSDTYLGTVNADQSRPANSPMVRNTLVVQNADGSLGATLHGGTAAAPASLVEVAGSPLHYWVADGLVEGGSLKVLYNRYATTGGGGLDVRPEGTALATFSLPGLTLTDLRTLPVSTGVAWGSEILVDGGHTYVYGAEHAGDGPKGLRIARTTALGATWEFWNGSGWTANEAGSARVLTGVGTAFSVTRIGAEYVLVTMDGNTTFSATVVGYPAPAPTGPFGEPRTLYEAPTVSPGRPVIYYDTTVHPRYSSGGTFVLSYNVNSLDPADVLADARIYRPRFVTVDWLAPPPDPSTLPPAPANLTTRDNGDGSATLTWQPAPGTGHVYRVHQRDVTLGTHFTRMSGTYPTTTATVPFLRDQHTYEFRVTAENAAGEGPPTNVAALTIHVGRPEPPSGLTATADDRGAIQLRWTRSPSAGQVSYQVLRRDATANEPEFRPIGFPDSTSTQVTDRDLEHQHTYQYKVTALRSGQPSDPTSMVSATAHYAPPPAPGNLRGQSSGDGGIDIAWDPPAPGLYYWIYWRDATNGEAFQKAGLPTDRTDWRVTSLRHGHVYEFKVTAHNAGGEGPASATIQVTSSGGLPARPANLAATAGDGRVTLNWSASSSPNVWYLVWMRDATAGQSWQQWQYPVTTCCSATAEPLTNGHTYEFKIAATNASGNSAPSNVVSARPMPPFPQAPSGLVATPGNGQVSLRWNASPTAGVWYWVEYRPAGGTWTRTQYPVTTCCSFTMTFLNNGTTYEFRVRSTNLSGDSPPSNVASARPSG